MARFHKFIAPVGLQVSVFVTRLRLGHVVTVASGPRLNGGLPETDTVL